MGKLVVAYRWSTVYSTEPWPTVCNGFLCRQNYPLWYDLYSVECDVKPQINKLWINGTWWNCTWLDSILMPTKESKRKGDWKRINHLTSSYIVNNTCTFIVKGTNEVYEQMPHSCHNIQLTFGRSWFLRLSFGLKSAEGVFFRRGSLQDIACQ